MSSRTTSLTAVHQAIVGAMRAHFGHAIRQFGAYQPTEIDGAPETRIMTPALLLEVDGLSPDDQAMHQPDRVAVRLSLVAHALLSTETDNLQVELAELAAATVGLVRRLNDDPMRYGLGNLWGLGESAELPEYVSAQPAVFAPGLHGYDSWAVRWEQVVYLPLDHLKPT